MINLSTLKKILLYECYSRQTIKDLVVSINKIWLFVICVKAIIYLLLYNFHDYAFNLEIMNIRVNYKNALNKTTTSKFKLSTKNAKLTVLFLFFGKSRFTKQVSSFQYCLENILKFTLPDLNNWINFSVDLLVIYNM